MNPGTLRNGTTRAVALCALSCLLTTSSCGPAQQPPSGPPAPIGGGTAEAGSPAEEKVLERLGQMPASKPETIGDLSVLAEAPYSAASGKTCRRVTLTKASESRTRLACSDGQSWQYVPDVFLAPSGP